MQCAVKRRQDRQEIAHTQFWMYTFTSIHIRPLTLLPLCSHWPHPPSPQAAYQYEWIPPNTPPSFSAPMSGTIPPPPTHAIPDLSSLHAHIPSCAPRRGRPAVPDQQPPTMPCSRQRNAKACEFDSFVAQPQWQYIDVAKAMLRTSMNDGGSAGALAAKPPAVPCL